MSHCWIWSDYKQLALRARWLFYNFISNSGSWNNCYISSHCRPETLTSQLTQGRSQKKANWKSYHFPWNWNSIAVGTRYWELAALFNMILWEKSTYNIYSRVSKVFKVEFFSVSATVSLVPSTELDSWVYLYTSIFRNVVNVDFCTYHDDIRNNNQCVLNKLLILANHNDNLTAKDEKDNSWKMQNSFLWRLRESEVVFY